MFWVYDHPGSPLLEPSLISQHPYMLLSYIYIISNIPTSLGEVEVKTIFQMQPHCSCSENKNFTPSTGHIAHGAASGWSAFFAMRVKYRLIFGVASVPSPFLQGVPSQSVPNWCWFMGLSHCRCRTLSWSLLIQKMLLFDLVLEFFKVSSGWSPDIQHVKHSA